VYEVDRKVTCERMSMHDGDSLSAMTEVTVELQCPQQMVLMGN